MRGERSVDAEGAQVGRARIHAALGDHTRLVIVEALRYSDQTPGDLAHELGIGTNLLAHHLDVLEDAGLVFRTPSRGDARRKYVRLRTDVLDELLRPETIRASSVLFVCTHNSARSQLATALWNATSGVPAESAGTEPAEQVHPLAVRVAERHNLKLQARPRSYEDVEGQPDLVISVCDLAREHLPPFGRKRLHWSIADPSRSGRLGAFEKAYREIERRVALLAPEVV